MPTAFNLDTDSTTADPLLERLRLATAGTYDIAGVLGRGGMAIVYVGEDLRLRRTIAIKVMEPHLSALPGMAARFLEEARTLARLQHPNIIVVHDVQQSHGLNFFVMTLVEGGGVDELCRQESPLAIDQAQWILSQASRGLAFAHSERTIHRDVKPANILVNVKGDVVLTDFGIAKVAEGGGLTKSGTQIGTPVYMSPEQFSDDTVGPASDQYALGVTAYEMLTGRPPFTGELYALIAAHGTRTPVPIRQLRPDCPAFLANAVMRMLEKRPADRWPSLDDVGEVLAAGLPGDGGAARRALAAAARRLHLGHRAAIDALTAQPPLSPVPTNASRVSAAPTAPTHILTIWPPGATIFVGGTLDLRASVSTPDGDAVTTPPAWTSSAPGIASVTATGQLTGLAQGTAIIRASVDGVVAEATVAVEPAPIARLTVAARQITLLIDDTAQPVVGAIDVFGTQHPDIALTWISRAPDIVALDAPGQLRALAPGQGTVDVSFGNLRQSIDVTVTRRPIVQVRIRPIDTSLELGAAVALTVDAIDDRGHPAVVEALRWWSSAPRVIHVDSAGRALAISEGSAEINAQIDDALCSIQLVAVEPPIASIALAIDAAPLEIGEARPVRLQALDASGGLRSSRGVRVWSTDPTVAAVDPETMTVLAVGAGVADVCAAHDIASDAVQAAVAGASVTLHVVTPGPVRLDVDTERLQLELHATVVVTAHASDSRGRRLPEIPVHWESDDPSIVSVNAAGVVRAIAPGSTVLRARVASTAGGWLSSDVAVVIAAPPAPPDRTPSVEPAGGVDASVDTPPDTPPDALVGSMPLPAPPIESIAPRTIEQPPVPAIAPPPPLPSVDSLRATMMLSPAAADGLRHQLAEMATAPVVAPPTSAADEQNTARGRSRGALIGLAIAVSVACVGLWRVTTREDTPPKQPAAQGPATEPGTSPGGSLVEASGDRVGPDGVVRSGATTDGSALNPVESGPRAAAGTDGRRTGRDTAATNALRKATEVAVIPGIEGPAQLSRKPATSTPEPPPVGPVSSGATVRPSEIPVAAEPVVPKAAEPTAIALPTLADVRAAADAAIDGLRQGRNRSPELAAFYADGAEHLVALQSGPVISAEAPDRGRVEAAFETRLSKRDSFGRPLTRFATVTIIVTRREGATITSTVTVGPLRRGK